MTDYYDDAEHEEIMTKEEELLISGRAISFMLETIKRLEAKVNALEMAEKGQKKLEDADIKDDDGDDDEEEERKFPSDSYSMMALNGPRHWSSWNSVGFFLFGVGIWIFQMVFLGVMVYSQTAVKRGTVEESDNPDDGFFATLVPPNAQDVVIVAQVVSLLAYVLFPESSMDDVVTACQLFPSFSKKGGPLWSLRFASIMRGIQAICSVIVVWILVMTSGTPVDIILNFTAINYVSGLDDASFELAERGVFGHAFQEETKRIADTNLPKSVQRTKTHVWYCVVMACIGASMFAFLINSLAAQASRDRWISETFRVEFTGVETFDKYSGCFRIQPDAKKNFKRYSYTSHLTDTNTTLGYCRTDRQWILFEGHNLGFDPCEANIEEIGIEIARSADTDSFDVSSVFDERWTSGSGAPLDLFFFESTDEEDLNCNLVLGDGFCDEVFNDPGYDYDQGDCCSATCNGSNCLRGGMTSVFGIEGMESFGFPDCRDDTMVPITIRLNAVTNSRDAEEWPGEHCYDKYYIDEENWRSTVPSPTYFDLDCDDKPVMTVNIDKSMEGSSETVWVKDGAKCRLLVRNSTTGIDGDSRCYADPIWYVNSTLFHGDKGDESMEIISHHSGEMETLNFKLLPNCFIEEITGRIRFEASKVYIGTGAVQKAIDWLIEDGPEVASCGADGFGTRFNMAYLYFATTPENEFIERGKHCTWKSIKCGVTGEIELIDLHASGLDGTFRLPNNVRDFPNLTRLELYNNKITSIETDIGRFTTLRELDIEDNIIDFLPTEIGKLEGLQRLFISENNIPMIPTEIGLLSNLEILQTSKNSLGLMPTEIGKLTSLFQLQSYGSDLALIPTEIGRLDSLEELYLNDNELLSLPTEIGRLTNLKRIHLGSNKLSLLPTEIGKLTNLKEIKLESNLLAALPTEMGLLTNLEEIFLGANDTVTCDDLPKGLKADCYDDQIFY
mmetsp:Transcript_1550/g.3595  ORF Transcript_1550/g.3595 Transcript_1550/m.3595 type:complete len:956 (+) Transcript_1550:363-3230(+)